ncbi:acyl-CoA dehydrogenase family protein [Haloactinomyces albus]|uniref:Alkylation response protein AidB-like acyl-CoA dehydrogenase n=1 Tax=Haloactinomyces albus TaxID=1352928 RepID=A0AAE4CMV2_9ACTN|nr:acyl-CoA dehydrogenase family protein [Haloactinomyces albus]MDR7303820.1 alkylation response protein AidB-like acyl-CoA dehydrogenase [Haloactinomyces albus]
MRFALTEEQRGFAEVLDDLLAASNTPQVVRSWAHGDHDAGLKLWQRLTELGVSGLLAPEEQGGLDADAVDLTVAFEALGRHAVPGPWVESAALLPALLRGTDQDEFLAGIASGGNLATALVTDMGSHALDADVATHRFVLHGTTLYGGVAGAVHRSVDPARRLCPVEAGAEVVDLAEATTVRAVDTAVLACSAQLLGAGEHLLRAAVDHARSRKQFGRAIGEYQALKHALADIRVALDFARPLVHVAALALREGSSDARRDVSAAKVAAGDAAYTAARTALQVHGAIGYTEEYDLGLWITKVRALVTAWGTPALHRARVHEAITRRPVEV